MFFILKENNSLVLEENIDIGYSDMNRIHLAEDKIQRIVKDSCEHGN
jgi:hypothetical protein